MTFYQQAIKLLSFEIFQNPVSHILIAILSYIWIFFIIKNIVKFTITHIEKYVDHKKMNFGIMLLDIIKNTPKYFFITLEIYIPLKLLTLPDIIDQIINWIFTFVILTQIIRILNRILLHSLSWIFSHKGKVEKTTQNALQLIIKISLWGIWLLILLSNLWVEISPLLASLWIWGLAIAFALQSMLQDVFSSFSIILSKPFKVGDYIKIWDKKWSVKEISMKATYITTVMGHEVRIPNKLILENELENYGKMKHRRIRFELWVTYDTAIKKLKKITKIISNIIDAEVDVEYERCRLTELWTYSIKFKISYMVTKADYQTYLVVNENILINILEALEKEQIELAFPTSVIHSNDKNIYPIK